MSLTDKAKNTVDDATGVAKGKIGRAAGDEDLEGRGQADQPEANAKQAGEHVKDAARDAKETIDKAIRE
jgi:uncharacterized protein YjbJ (UPF0337 family)